MECYDNNVSYKNGPPRILKSYRIQSVNEFNGKVVVTADDMLQIAPVVLSGYKMEIISH